MGKTLSMGYNKTIGEVISDANAENIELDKKSEFADIQMQKYEQGGFPMIQGTSSHNSALKAAVYDEEGKKKKLSEMTGKEKLAIVGQSMAETWG